MTHQDASEGTVGLGSHALRFPVNSSGSGLRNRFAGPPRCRRLGRCFGLVRELGVGFFEFRPRRHDGAVKRTFEVAADLVLIGGAPHAAARREPRDGALELLEALRQGSQRHARESTASSAEIAGAECWLYELVCFIRLCRPERI